METIELHINQRYYAQHPALKSVYGKGQSVIGGKLFSFNRTVFELAQEYSDSKTSHFNNCSSNEALTICQGIGCFHNFYMCCIIIISFEGSYICIVILAHKGRAPLHGGKTLPLLPHSQYIRCTYIIEDGENLQPYS